MSGERFILGQVDDKKHLSGKEQKMALLFTVGICIFSLSLLMYIEREINNHDEIIKDDLNDK